MKISKLNMSFKFIKLFFYRIRKRMWFLPAVSEITVDQLLDLMNSNLSPLLIDVRGAKDFNKSHLTNAKEISILKLANSEDLQSFKKKEIVTICLGGGMSLIAAEILVKAGFKDVKSLKGGMNLWIKKGYPATTSA